MFQVKSTCGVEVLASGRLHPSPVKSRSIREESMIRWLVDAIGLSIVASHAVAAEPIEIGIGYLGQAGVKSKLSLIEQPAENDGIAGARLAIEDNNTTGRFLNQRFSLEEVRLKDGEDVAKAATTLAGRNGFIIADLPADALLKAADALRGSKTVLFN